MLKLLVPLLVVVLVIGVPVARATRRLCGRAPGTRPWLLAGAIVLIIAVALAVPHLDKAIPHSMSESPAGLIPFFGAAVGLGIIAVAAIAVIAGAILSLRPEAP